MMGRTQQTFELVGFTSAHNSQQDKDDEADWRHLCERLQMIAREHRYESLNIQVLSSGE